MLRLRYLFLLPLLASLTACEQIGLETAPQAAARVEAEGKATGGACRQSGRALEDCYEINAKMPKAAIFAGWRDMDAYMRENKLETIKPEYPQEPARIKAAKKKAAAEAEDDAKASDKSSAKAKDH